ncbi:hypothetical protein OSB04_025202 [Centaurea solstitialis]|uniref:Uncharacterized protein n=1 Tax=Centaurea solstitialis TaxID=347529 RepID=A0AA38WB48_9ASTR|nr:hypothetical protein OSB04_025202 [Centaurea solstitialis]
MHVLYGRIPTYDMLESLGAYVSLILFSLAIPTIIANMHVLTSLPRKSYSLVMLSSTGQCLLSLTSSLTNHVPMIFLRLPYLSSCSRASHSIPSLNLLIPHLVHLLLP